MMHASVCRCRPAVIVSLILAAAVTVAGCGGSEEPEGEAPVPAHADSSGEVVQLDTAQIRMAGITIQLAETTTATGLALTGTITYDANRVSHVGSRTAGRILSLNADIGEPVTTGQRLAMLESPEVGRTRSEEHEAEALLAIAGENYRREQRLEQQGISSRKELLDAEADLRRAEASLGSARERLRVLGAGHGSGSEFAITAPFAGVVVDRQASRGEQADPEDQLFTIADLSRVWIELDVFERDLARIRIGQTVAVSTGAHPGRTFRGRIAYLAAVLDTARRTARARVEIPNSDRALKPGMFATALVRTQDSARSEPLIVIPREAVQDMDGATVVFVPGDRPGEFRRIPVEVGEPMDSVRVIIRNGLSATSRVVVGGAFLLRSEMGRAQLAEEEH